ncbi:MAG: Asp-tRNA(Asn)/Glu-tRNA(Gln) amidotransferase subunit GatC [Clostridia bacterium]|nr:Asp-tRNA(Asn)/Glu-tRNA(Gln) amidotransferase subunit GatC [Clostridia bacterium]
MNKEILKRLEELNQIKLNDAQRDDVLSFFAKREADHAILDEIDIDGMEPMVHVNPITVVLREDVIEQSLSRQDLQAQAPVTDAGYFCVPRVIE